MGEIGRLGGEIKYLQEKGVDALALIAVGGKATIDGFERHEERSLLVKEGGGCVWLCRWR